MIRTSNKNDINDIVKLWKEAFGDSENEILFFLNSCPEPLNILINEIDGETASMLFLFEGDMHINGKDYPSYYLYAAATLKKYRGRGLMAELLKYSKIFADNNGKHFICLKPAEKSLFNFYEKHGYKTVFTVKVATYDAMPSGKNAEYTDKISPVSLRNESFEGFNYFKWNKQSVEFAFLHNSFFGGEIFMNCKGYSLYMSDDNKNTVKETTFTSRTDVLKSLTNNKKITEVFYPPWTSLEGEIKPYGMITAVKNENKKIVDLIENAYLGLTLD